ncbi:MAG: sugar phosphate nucleotidyltransferase [Candidatus Pelagibacter sp.]|tara:strand:- start:835 stop:1575 length:741 start_codon:yes stop_codon:yes gene_type:complete
MNIKQCVVLAGGLGSRLGKLTKNTPKPLLKINNIPFLFYLISKLKKEGIKKILILIWKKPKQFYNIDFNKVFDLDIKIIKERKKLGTGGSIANCFSFLDKNFFLVNGDTIFDIPLKNLEKIFLKKKINLITACHFSDKLNNKYKYFFNKKNNLINYKLYNNKKSWVSGGTYILNKKIFKKIKIKNIDLDREIILQQFKKNKISAKKYYNDFIDIGTKSDFIKTKNIIKKIFNNKKYKLKMINKSDK